MNKNMYSLLIKFISTFIITWITFTLFAYSTFGFILIVSVAVTLFGFVGDKLLLPRFGNISASISDGALAVVIAYFIALVFNGLEATTYSFIVYALFTAVSEYLFHMYLMNNDEKVENTEIRRARPSYNMETSDELDVRNDIEENDRKYDELDNSKDFDLRMEASDELDARNDIEENDRKSSDDLDNSEDFDLRMEASEEFNEKVLDETELRRYIDNDSDNFNK